MPRLARKYGATTRSLARAKRACDTWGSIDAAMHGGASTWITGSYDPKIDTLFWGTGNPNPDWDGVPRPGDNLYSNSTLALDPDTGAMKYYFQYTPHDVWDFDGVNEVILADIGNKKLWLHGDRNGFLYAIDRTNGRFVYGSPISQINWMTGFTEDGRPIVNEEKFPALRQRVEGHLPRFGGRQVVEPDELRPAAQDRRDTEPRDLHRYPDRAGERS